MRTAKLPPFVKPGRRRRWLAVVVILSVVAGAIAVELVMEDGFSVRDKPNVVDVLVARWWRRLAVPREERGVSNPLPGTTGALARGREHFAADCAACHGSDGRGGTPLGDGLYPKPPDLASPGTQSLGDGEIFWIIRNGVRLSGMPAWSPDGEASDASAWEVVHFIRALPRLSPRDVEAVQAMRPRSPMETRSDEAARRFLGEPRGAPPSAADAHDEATLMGTVTGADAVRLQVRTTAGASVSFLLDHGGPTTIMRGSEAVGAGALRQGDRVVIRAARDEDWWLAREVQVSAKGSQP